MARQHGLGGGGARRAKVSEIALEVRRDAGRFGLQTMRERTSEVLCDLKSANPDAEFETTCSVANLGSAVFFETQMTPARLDRTPLRLQASSAHALLFGADAHITYDPHWSSYLLCHDPGGCNRAGSLL